MSECVKVLRDELPYNLHIFVNSVEFIAKVIDTLKLAPEAVKVVCSTSGESRQENQRKLGNAYPIGQPSDPAKKVNFYTSTCFEGCDIFDPDGVTFIVSINEQYVRIVDNRLVVEKNLANMDIVNFKISRHIYATYVNLTDELQRNGYKVTVQTYSKVVEHLAANPTARTTFRELFDEYCRLKTMTEQFFVVESPAELCAVIEQRHPLVKQAYDELGTAKVQALKYHVGNIRRELVKGLSIGDDYKIVKMINDAFQKQTPIAKNKAKERLQEIYDTLGLQRKAKATDLAQ